MLLTTTPTVEGKPVRTYYGVVTGETIIGANFVRDFFAGIRDFVGGRSKSYERVGIDVDYETVGSNGSMLMVSCSGTAVTI